MKLLFPARDLPALPVLGTEARYPVHRIFCVGRNYAEHAREMGAEIDRSAPFWFTKSPFHLVQSGATVPYPPGTADYHHEVELVAALGAPLFRAEPGETAAAVFGYAAGLDMTRRDLQAVAKEKRHPWDISKDVEGSAVVGRLTPAAGFSPADQTISLEVNGAARQSGRLSDMARQLPELLSDLSHFYHLGPGDLIFTGTPSGVGSVRPGDEVLGQVEGLDPVVLTMGPAE